MWDGARLAGQGQVKVFASSAVSRESASALSEEGSIRGSDPKWRCVPVMAVTVCVSDGNVISDFLSQCHSLLRPIGE